VGPPLRFGVAYDFRNPPGSGLRLADLYARTLAQIRRVDALGYDHVWITEHHFAEDGYMPSFVAVAGAIAASTTRVAIGSDILILPFHSPLRLAEDLAVLDNLSGGRMMLGVGLGYARHEFRAFGVSRRDRGSLTDEGIEILQRAWRGERFSHAGRHYRLEDVRVTPDPVQPGGPPLWIAAMSEAGARRAARFGTHFLPQGTRVTLDAWRVAVSAAGRAPEELRVGIIRPWLVTDDRNAIWPRIREAERYRASVYARWIRASGDAMPLGERGEAYIPQTYVIGDPAHCIAEIEAFVAEYGFTDLITWGAPPGVPPELLDESHARFAREVLPHFRGKHPEPA
jgi:alkanesulfonate monooxygenase SsuD/methylene tetrahydromethanopterin reductase-like flavin-dependent oxidoreductase (luciferase family)